MTREEGTYGTDVCKGNEIEYILNGGFEGVGGGWADECWRGHRGSIKGRHVERSAGR